MRRQGPGFLLQWLRRRVQWELQRARNPGAAQVAPVANQLNNEAIESAFRAALPHYPLQGWAGPVVLFRPPLDRHWKVSGGQWVSAGREYVFPDNDWTRFMPALRVMEVPGDHDSMVLEPNVRVLAGFMKDIIATAESDRSST